MNTRLTRLVQFPNNFLSYLFSTEKEIDGGV